MENQAGSAAKTPPAGLTAEAGKAAAFDPKTKTICIQALQSLRAGFSQSLLYSQETKQYEKVVDTTFEALNTAIETLNGLHLSISRSEAIVNAQRLDTPLSVRSSIDQIDRFIYNAGLSSIKFEKGLTIQELAPFLQIVARKKFASSEGAAINKQLREMGIAHIQVGELRYVGLSEGEHVVSRSNSSSANHSGVQGAVSEMAGTFQSTMDQIQDVQARKQLQVEMTGQLIEHDDAMLASMLTVGVEHLRENNSEDMLALAAVPRRDSELLNSILRLARQVLMKGIDNEDQIFVGLRDFIKQLAEPYRKRAEDILNQLEFDESTSFLLPDWLIRATASLKSGSAEERLDGILVQSPNALLDERMFPQILDVLDEFSVARLEAQAEALTTHVAGAVKAPTKKMRIKAVERLSKLLERSMEQTSKAVKIIEDALLDACLHETCDEVMVLLVDYLARRCEHHYKLENYERSLEHLEWITGLEQASRSALRDDAANLARTEREKLAKTAFAQTLPNDMLAADVKGKVSARMVQLLGKELWMRILELIRTVADVETARVLTTYLAGFGKDAHQLFFSSFEHAETKQISLRLLELAPAVSTHPALWKPAYNLMRHADATVRERAVEAVLKLDSEASFKAIFETMRQDPDLAHRSGLLAAVARSADPKAFQMLMDELHSALNSKDLDEPRVALTLEALSGFENDDLVAPVTAMIYPKGRTLVGGESRTYSKFITMAAIKALAKVYKNPMAIEALERARTQKDPEISRLALATVRGLLAAKHAQDELSGPPPTSPSASSLSPIAGKSGTNTAVRRRGFEELQGEAEVSSLFQRGAGIGGARPSGSTSGLTRATPREPEPMPDVKPILEGQLEDMGLANTIRMIGGRDGTLIIGTPTEARVTVRARKIIHCVLGELRGIEALAKIYEIQKAPFAYFTSLPAPPANCEVDIKEIEIAIREFFRTGAPDETQFY
jgi:hypothetical protein